MEIENMTIGQAKELVSLFGSRPKKKSNFEQGKIRIVILQRGWVMIGKMFKNGYDCKLEDANVIRSWGTSKGLGELALNGPTANTKLDKCGVVEFHEMTTIANIPCDESKWSGKL